MSFACTVVIPVYNAENVIGEQMRALSDQDFDGPFEVLLADNGSTDGSVLAAERAASGLTMRTVDASKRRGPSAARNIGAKSARSELLLFCDADDLVDPAWVRTMHAALEAGAWVGGPYLPFASREDIWIPRYDVSALPTAWDRTYAFGGNFGIRREEWIRLGGFDESLTGAEEIEFAWRAHDAGLSLTFVPEARVNYRVRDSFRGRLWHEFNSGRGTTMLAHMVAPETIVSRSWKSQLRHEAMLLARFPRNARGPQWAAWAATLAFEAGVVAANRQALR